MTLINFLPIAVIFAIFLFMLVVAYWAMKPEP